MRISDWSSDVCSSDLVNGPSFSISDPTPMLAQARAAALKTAKAQADFYAQAAGYRAARLVSLAESNSGGQPPMPMMVTARFKADAAPATPRSEEHTSELQSLMRISYAVFCLKKKKEIDRMNE